jgi:competence protein ComEC
VALAAGIACADAVRLDLAPLLASGALCAAIGVAGVRRPVARAVAAATLVGHAGALALTTRLADAEAGAASLPMERTLEASVASTRVGVRGLRLVLEDVRAADGDAAPVPRRLLLLADPGDRALEALPPGARVRARLRLRPWLPLRNPGRGDAAQSLARAGIGALATLADARLWVRVPEEDRIGLRAWLHPLRRHAADRLRALGPGGGLLCALGVGERAGLEPELEDAFARLGLAHLLSVSGLHLVLAAGLAYRIALAAFRRIPAWTARRDARALALAAAVLAATLYALLAGFEVPVQRSLALVIASAVALGASRPERAFHPLAAAALAVLAWAPESLFDAGAQLSFAACAGLIAAARRGPVGLPGWRGHAASLLRTTAAASAASAPLAAWHGLPSAPLALVSNALAVPWTGVALLPASLAASALALLPDAPPAVFALQAAERLAAASLAAVAWAAPLARVTGAGSPPPLVLSGAIALAVWVCRAPGTWRPCAGALAIALLLSFAPPRALTPGPPRLVALDVGSGDALLVQGRDASLLVDAGSALAGRFDRGRDAVVPALRALGVRRLDLVVATHADLDHRGGLPAVLAALPVGALWLPLGGAADPDFAALVAAARAAGVATREVGRGSPPFERGDLRVRPLWPAPGATGSQNERSLALRVEVGARSVLLLGDLGAAERALLEDPASLRADVLVLPHHGSRRSSSRALLQAAGAPVRVVSAPCVGRLPHPDALRRARESGSLWWTGRDGAVRVGLGERVVVVPEAEARSGCGRSR